MFLNSCLYIIGSIVITLSLYAMAKLFDMLLDIVLDDKNIDFKDFW